MAAIEARDLRRTYRTRPECSGAARSRSRPCAASASRSRGASSSACSGPNGAGKTTTIKMLITLLLPTVGHGARARPRRGRGRARGAQAHRLRLRRRPGPLRAALRATTTCATSPSSTACPPREQKPRIAELLELVGLTGREKERVEGYSRGMRQRLHIARGLLHDPRCSSSTSRRSGSTRSARASCARRSPALVEAGKTVLLTTHYMFEADELCDRIAVIAQGRIVAEGTPRRPEGAASPTGTVVEIEAFGVAGRRGRARARSRRRDRPSRSRSATRRRCSSSRPSPAPS